MQSDISLYEFSRLSKKEKIEVLCEFSVCLCERPDAAFRIVLYQLSNFYVEIKYHKRNNSIAEFQSFTSTKLLEPFLAQIDISFLLAA
jgi:hypothetical protein